MTLERHGILNGPDKSPPELGVLLALLSDDQTFTQALARVTDWGLLLDLTLRHGLLMPLHERLAGAQAVNENRSALLPPEFSDRLRDLARANVVRSLRMTKVLLKVLEQLRAKGIRAMPLKGPVLAQAVYGDLAARQFTDLDVLVRRGEVSAAIATLEEAGFQTAPGYPSMDRMTIFRSIVELELTRPADKVMVDLHWALGPPDLDAGLPPERLWARAEPVDVLGRNVPQPAPADQFMAICTHGARDEWHRLEELVTLAKLMERHPEVEWQKTIGAARGYGCYRRCLMSVLLLRDLLGVDRVPQAVDCAEADEGIVRLAAKVRDGLVASAPSPRGDLHVWRWRAATMDSTGRATAFFLKGVAIPGLSDYQAVDLPRPLEPLYYLLRPARLAGKYGALAWRMSARPPRCAPGTC